MTIKNLFYTLAVVVLMGAMAVVALAGGYGEHTYGPADSSVSSEPEAVMEHAVAEDIREPIGTGALPHESMSKTEDPEGWVNMNVADQESSSELRGRPNIQSGGGGD